MPKLKRLLTAFVMCFMVMLAPLVEARGEQRVYTITAYCGCYQCCEKENSFPPIGSGGVPLYEGTHVAARLPNGTKIHIQGLGNYEVQDTPARDIIDIYFANHIDALNFGVQQRLVTIIN